MAEVRLTPSLPAVTPAPARTGDAVRAAQRAFFDAALTASQTAAPARAAATATASPDEAAIHPRPQGAREAAPASGRSPRPGSLLDIRV